MLGELLRLLLLETEYNLAVLEVVRQAKGVDMDDPRFFAYAHALQLDAVAAFLIEWRVVSARYPFSFDLGGTKEWERIAKGVDRATMLEVARFVCVRGNAVQALAVVEPQVRRPLNLPLRLRNLRAALLLLRRALLEDPKLAFLRPATDPR